RTRSLPGRRGHVERSRCFHRHVSERTARHRRNRPATHTCGRNDGHLHYGKSGGNGSTIMNSSANRSYARYMVMERKGRVAKATHVGIPPDLVEEEHGREAFAGPVSHLYRTQSPTAWIE